MAGREYIPGDIFGRLTLISEAPPNRWGRCFTCQCACGNTTVVSISNLKRTRSCGCLIKERVGRMGRATRTHGHTPIGQPQSPTYQSWHAMKERCLRPTNVGWPRYGGRGITVCARWQDSFENFLADMGPRPRGTALDRFPNNDGNYEPGNCRWATRKEQLHSRAALKFLTHAGETLLVSDWAARIGISQEALHARLKLGWSVARAVTTPQLRFRRK